MRSVIFNLLMHIIAAGVFFLSAGYFVHVGIYGYVFFLLISLLNFLSLFIFNRSLLSERSHHSPETKEWDKILLLLYFLGVVIIVPVISGLDYRFIRPNMPFYSAIIGFALYLLSGIVNTWAMIINKFFVGTAVIQKEREQRVIDSGPYSIVRHPGYFGMLISLIAVPLVLRSYTGLLVAFIFAPVVIIRTYLEDRMLTNELEGYKEFKKKTKYRIFPYIW